MLSAMWLGLVLPSVTPHCDVVAQGLHDLVAHSHADHHRHHSAAHAEPDRDGRGCQPPVDQQCEVANDTILADIGTATTAAAKVVKLQHGAAIVVAERFPHGFAAAGPPAPPRWRGERVSRDHFQRNHRLLI